MSAARWALAVALAWLMPVRAARRIREQDGEIGALISVLALATIGSSKPLRKAARTGGWWNLPHPLAVVLAALTPWRAVAELRSSQHAFRYVVDRIIVQGNTLDELRGRPSAGAAPERPPLYLVGQPGSDAPPYSGRHLKGVPRTRGSAA